SPIIQPTYHTRHCPLHYGAPPRGRPALPGAPGQRPGHRPLPGQLPQGLRLRHRLVGVPGGGQLPQVRPRALHLGHLPQVSRCHSRQRHRQRDRRRVPSLHGRCGQHGEGGLRRLPLLHLLVAHFPQWDREVQQRRRGLLPPAHRLHARQQHHSVRRALPLRPAGGSQQPVQRLAQPQGRARLHGFRRLLLQDIRRPGEELVHHQRAADDGLARLRRRLLRPRQVHRLPVRRQLGHGALHRRPPPHPRARRRAVKVYRDKYQRRQNGTIGILLDFVWYEPLTYTVEDEYAAHRAREFTLGWYMHPITFGHYPETMRKLVGSRLPNFTAEQSKLVQGSADIIGVNHYTTYYVRHHAFSKWLYVVPWGFYKAVMHVKNKFRDPLILIGENGIDQSGSDTLPHALYDTFRIDYFDQYLHELKRAIADGARVTGYFAWSLLDNFEWRMGFTSKFGLVYVDRKTFTRYPKDSTRWFRKVIKSEE
uniref:Uncharacterized protein n=1 Tax=Aegilops tauschii subsp. strangulata TaxID=200361 RepID=A0A453HGS8_AEGTS